MKKLKYIDLFAGCGGLSEGFTSTNLFEGIAHIEWELPMVQTLRNRLNKKWGHSKDEATQSVIHFDIQKHQELINGGWSEESILKFGSTNSKKTINKGLKGLVGDQEVDLIIGGPPCQAYSLAGRNNQVGKDDYRNYLFESFIKVVEAFKPKLFVFENVPGILSAKPSGEPVINRIYQAFDEAGYEILKPEKLKFANFSASDFEVPQNRNRIIIIGIRKDLNWDLNSVYKHLTEQKTDTKVTVRDAIGNLPKILPLSIPIKEKGKNVSHKPQTENLISQHEARYHNPSDIKVFREWTSKSLNKLPLVDQLAYYNKLKGVQSKYAKYRSLEWDKPSFTVTAHLHKDGLLFIHPDPEQARSITIREAGILQSFPTDYEFLGSNSHCYKMIGNAVPPKMAEHIALGIFNFLKDVKK